jgi:intein-encoded DNA endonuclease-like protein
MKKLSFLEKDKLMKHFKESTRKYVKVTDENEIRRLIGNKNIYSLEIKAYRITLEVIEKAMGKKLKITTAY